MNLFFWLVFFFQRRKLEKGGGCRGVGGRVGFVDWAAQQNIPNCFIYILIYFLYVKKEETSTTTTIPTNCLSFTYASCSSCVVFFGFFCA